ncbi:hypothetical protein [Mycolicibacterium iranicum]|uniref:Uncharacterized protein n=1 Tax=Mycolicibacterium iranicum TaxID=912594 RepID=A0ABT4HLQ4_MYCIR|nr:hypothetical protein [Mycolicibacterium iranicum]MCZ0730679.1 hypothetical protein [Mycolicibacterium iranicum]
MSETHFTRQPRKHTDATIADFTILVRVPRNPSAIKVFTEAERPEAAAYAAETGGTIEPLPQT